MIDMKRSDESMCGPYPCTSFVGEDLEKLGLPKDVEVGDMIHVHAMLTVTAVSKSDGPMGKFFRIEAEMRNVAAEDEDEENAEAGKSRKSKLYGR
jgi:hypothetical protein